MQKEYEEMQPEIYEYNDSLYKYEAEFNNDSSHNFVQKYLLGTWTCYFFDCALYEQINDMKIDSYDKYIDKMVNKANFSYMTNGKAEVTGVLDFSELGLLKM